jgi:serine/threonine-protein kinase
VDALIAALSEDPDARRRARFRRAGIGVAVAALITVVAAGWARDRARHDPCEHPEQQLLGAWDEDIKGRVRAAFLGTGRSYAQGTVDRVFALLDRQGAEWAKMRAEVCVASHRDEHRREILALRDACLDRRRGQLQALATLFAEKADAGVLDRAVSAAASLPPLAYCADTEALTARVRPPEDAAVRAQVAALEPRADRLEALYTAGKYEEGLALGEALLAETAAVPYAPLRARALYWMGRLRDASGQYPQARAALEDAAAAAAEGRDEILASLAWAQLLLVVGTRQQRFEEASVIRSLGRGVLARTQDERAQAAWLNSQGSMATTSSKHAEARALYERALALREKVLGPEHPDFATSLNNLGNLFNDAGDYPEALAMQQRVLALRERVLGPEHPDVGISLNNLAIVVYSMGDYPRAKAAQERVLALYAKSFSPDHPAVATSIHNLAMVLFAMGDYPQALAKYEQALALREKALGPDRPDVAYSLAGKGRTLVRLGELDAALPVIERSRAVLEKALGASNPDLTEPLLYLGELSLARHRPDEAVPLLERALALGEAEYTSETQLALAEALWQVGKDRPRARALVEQARAAYERIHHHPGLERATRWLSNHP